VTSDIRHAQRRGITNQLAEHPVPRRRRPNLTDHVRVNARRDEPRQRAPRLVKNANRRVPSVGELPSRLENTLEHPLYIQVAKHPASNIEHVS